MSFWDGSKWTPDTAHRAASAPRHGRLRHVLEVVAEGGMVAVLGIGLIAGTAMAAKGGHNTTHGGTSAAISVPDGVFGATTTATVSSAGSGATALANCYQGGLLVYAQYVSVDASGHATFQLGPTPMWASGSASCTAEVGAFSQTGRWQTLASTTFSVSG